MTSFEDVERARRDEQYIRKCQRELKREEKSVRSSLLWFTITVVAIAAMVAIHYLDV